MFGLEDVVCCSRDYGEEEYHPTWFFSSGMNMDWDEEHTRVSGGMDKSDAYFWHHTESIVTLCRSIVARSPFLDIHVSDPWDIGTLEAHPVRFGVLDDWATALHAHHVKDVVHGNLTPKSVGVVDGRGTLSDPGQGEPSADDDLHGARWAATELFCMNNRDLHPTKMSDVYSFACLMLQILTREVPYCGTKRPEQVVYLKYLGREPIDSQTPKVADHYVAFMRWCWSPEPHKRPTMETVVDFIHEEIRRLGKRGD